MSRWRWLLAGMVWAAGVAAAQPTIYAVTNAATYAPPGLPTSALAQGSLFVVQGKGLAASDDLVWPTLSDATKPLTTQLNGASIQVTVNGTAASALIVYTVGGIANPNYTQQVLALLPSSTAAGNGALVLSNNGASSAAVNVTVAPSTFGVFTWNTAGSGPGVMTDSVTGERKTAIHPAKPGDYITIWGTGLGPTSLDETKVIANPTAADVAALQNDAANLDKLVNPSLLLGTTPVALQYAGRSQYPGEDQVVFQVPSGAPLGCFENLVLMSNGVPSNTFSLAISADGSPCSDANGFSASDTAGLPAMQNANGSFKLGAVQLTRNSVTLISANGSTATVSSDTVAGNFGAYNWLQLAGSQGPAQAPSPGSCAVNNFKGLDPTPVDPVARTLLNAGSALTVTGPGESAKTASSTAAGTYTGLLGGLAISSIAKGSLGGSLPDYLKATGNFSVTGPGGSDVSAFSTQVNIPKPAAWSTNLNTMDKIPRGQPYTVSWTGADPNGFVSIVGISSTGGTFDPQKNTLVPNANTPGAAFLCVAPGGANGSGSFTIPPAILQSMPVSPDPSRIVIGAGFLLVGSSNAPVKFTANGMDAGYLTYRILTGKNVLYQQ